MNRHVFRIAATVATLTAGAATAQDHRYGQGYGYGNDDGYRPAQLVRCESTQSRTAVCRVDMRGQVRLVRQLSRTQCVQGRNWSANGNAIRVTGGCRADFQVVGDDRYGNGSYPYRDRERARSEDGVFDDRRYRGRTGQTVQCVPTHGGRTYCGDAQARYTMTSFRNPNCIEGRNWGRDQRGTWVSGNCNLQFTRTPHDGDQAYRGYDERDGYRGYDERDGYRGDDQRYVGVRTAQVIECQSTSAGRTYCGDRDTRYVLSSMGNGNCSQGETYGRDENGTWVSGNCDAQFGLQTVDEYDR